MTGAGLLLLNLGFRQVGQKFLLTLSLGFTTEKASVEMASKERVKSFFMLSFCVPFLNPAIR